MPNVTYSGTQGIVQSTGTGGFTVQGVGIALDSEDVSSTAGGAISSVGVTRLVSTGAHTMTVANPVNVAGAAGQMKLIVRGAGGHEITIRSALTADLIGDNLKAANDYALLMWTGSDWICVAELTSA
tara:strand:- start:4947 stop:5327 length:381 start_codon:yes stop_codon:yes gene_type:complete